MKDVYVVFSSTPYKIGKFIRIFTGEFYNHVSIMFDENMLEAYSFGRKHVDTAFYGGIIKDSVSRYKKNGVVADVSICRISVDDDAYSNALNMAKTMYENKQYYVYNFFSAVVSIFQKRIFIENSFTCVEFCAFILSMMTDKIQKNGFYSVEDLYEIFKEFSVYKGEFNISGEEDEEYNTRQGVKKSFKGASCIILELIKRMKKS